MIKVEEDGIMIAKRIRKLLLYVMIFSVFVFSESIAMADEQSKKDECTLISSDGEKFVFRLNAECQVGIVPKIEAYSFAADGNISYYAEVLDIVTEEIGENVFVTSCMTVVGQEERTEGISPLASQEREIDDDVIVSILKVTYTISGTASNPLIKISNVSGSWAPSGDFGLDIQNQEVMVTNSRGGTLKKNPNSRNFSYDTGWGFVSLEPQIPDVGYGPRAYSEADFLVTGMGYNWSTVFNFLAITFES